MNQINKATFPGTFKEYFVIRILECLLVSKGKIPEKKIYYWFDCLFILTKLAARIVDIAHTENQYHSILGFDKQYTVFF